MMRIGKQLCEAVVGVATMALLAGAAVGVVPLTMDYQVMLTDDEDQPLADQAVELLFTLWTQPSGGVQEWTETHNTMTNSIGVVSVILGSVTPLDPDDFTAELWLEVRVDGEIMDPRRELASAPYALHAGDSDLLGGAAPGAYSLDGHDHDGRYYTESELNTSDGTGPNVGSNRVSWDNLTDMPAGFADGTDDVGAGGDSDWTIAGDDMYSAVPGDVGIGVTDPAEKLEVGGELNPLVRVSSSGGGAPGIMLFRPSAPARDWKIDSQGGELNFSQSLDDGSSWDEMITFLENGNVGIGETSPTSAKLHVVADGSYAGRFDGGGGIYVENGGNRAAEFRTDYPTGNFDTHVLHAEYTYSGSNHGVAVHGESVPADGYGSGGVFVGGYSGVQGGVLPTGTSPDGYYYGVIGSANHVTVGEGENFGVYGLARDNEGNSGVFGEARNGTSTCGVKGSAWDGTQNIGVSGYAEGGTYAWGVYGAASMGSILTHAAWFNGDVEVTGHLSKGTGSFKIDHPLDPEDKYLYHSFVESPDMMNVYNGNVVLDARGEAWVELPEWFGALNRDFRYQLTCIGGFAPVYVADEISGNRFRIAGGEVGMKVSWLVTGIRQDPLAEANRIQVEVDKRPDEVGKYIHPEVYGRPREEGIGYVPPPARDPRLRELVMGGETP